MSENDEPVLMYTTFPSAAAAETCGARLVDHGWAACVNILPGMTSLYMWNGERQLTQEAVMVIKTRRGRTETIIADIRADHTYDNPSVLVLPVSGGSETFIEWILEVTRRESVA